MSPNYLQQLFFHALKRGTGEAYLLAKAYPNIDFAPYITLGALNNYAYDGQCESSRAPYIFELIQSSPKAASIRAALLKGMLQEEEDTWNLTHMLKLALLHAQQGDEAARAAIYQVFDKCPIPSADWAGVEEILALDGWNGLLYVVETYGRRLAKNPEDWQCDLLLRRYQEDNPAIDVAQQLAATAQDNPYIQRYLDEIQSTKERWKRHQEPPQLYSSIVEEILQSRFIAPRFAKQITLAQRQEIGFALMDSQCLEEQEKLMKVFMYCAFPFDSNFILEMAQQVYPEDCYLQHYALRALSFLKSPAIRALALERLPQSDEPALYSDLLHANYQPQDAALLIQVVRNTADEDVIEDLASSYVRLYQLHPTPACQGPLEALYAKMNCGIHRHSVLELLLANGVLSEQLRREIQYDSYEPTRELVK